MPVVAVTSSRDRGWRMWAANRLALSLRGIEAVRVMPGDDWVDFDRFDGLLIGGGDDIGTQLYGGVPTPNIRIDPDRDRLEVAAIEAMMPRAKPVMGLCRGAQMINVALGGSLHEDIYEVYRNAPRMRSVLPRKYVRLVDGTALRRICSRPSLRVNSLHHQSVDRLGEGLKISALDDHEIVQGIEFGNLSRQFVLGVQWHPEFLFYRTAHRRLFTAFAGAVRGMTPEASLADEQIESRRGAW